MKQVEIGENLTIVIVVTIITVGILTGIFLERERSGRSTNPCITDGGAR